MEGWTGTEVIRALTSYDVMLSPACSLMKWPQYGSQRKLVMILIMILLCLQQFQFYSLCVQRKIVT